jgi:hypothetical protein
VRATADDRSVQEGAAVAKRSIARSLMPIYPPISTSDRGNRSPHGSLLTTCSRKSGKHACTICRWAEGLARLLHRLGRADVSAVCSPTQPHLMAEAHGRRARREHRAPSVPAPLLAPPQGCLDGGRRSTRKAALPRVGLTRPCSLSTTAARFVLGHWRERAAVWRCAEPRAIDDPLAPHAQEYSSR